MTKKLNHGSQGRFACILYDSTFKVIVLDPQNEQLAIDIIQLLIPGKHITGITFLETEKYGLAVSEKNVIFDLLCRDDDTGEEFLVEVQNAEEDSFMDYSLRPVYVICMANFKLKHQSDEAIEDGYISRYALRNGRNAELMTPSLNFVFLEMGRLKLKEGQEDQCVTLLEKFIFSMKYMHTMKKRPASFDDPMLNRLYTAAELANLTVKQRQNYDNAMFTELDRIAQINFAKKAGVAEGKAEGREEGIALMLRAKSLIKEGKSVQDVCKETGLAVEIVSALA